MGLPAVVSFSTIGDTAADFLSMISLNMASGVPLGTAMHYLIGSVLGIVFGTAASQVDALRVNTIKKGLVFGILYTQVISQPILAAAPII